jgi:predicted nucleotidyltransferase
MSTTLSPNTCSSPVRLLLGDYHLRLLALLLLRPSEDFHLREVARLTGVPAGPANRELRRFLAAGLVTRRQAGNQVRYQADRGCIVFDEMAALLRKTTGMADIVRESLSPLARKITLAFIFGSAAQGKEGPFSDADVMIVGSPSFEEVVAAIEPTQTALGRPINPVIMAAADFAAKRSLREGFLSRILAEPKIMLIGSLDEPGQPRKDGPAQAAHRQPRRSGPAARRSRAKPR